jgi:hypothetical protein
MRRWRCRDCDDLHGRETSCANPQLTRVHRRTLFHSQSPRGTACESASVVEQGRPIVWDLAHRRWYDGLCSLTRVGIGDDRWAYKEGERHHRQMSCLCLQHGGIAQVVACGDSILGANVRMRR